MLGGRYHRHRGSSGSLLSSPGSGGLGPSPGSATDPQVALGTSLGLLSFRRLVNILSVGLAGSSGGGQCGAVSKSGESNPEPHFTEDSEKPRDLSKESSTGGRPEGGMS